MPEVVLTPPPSKSDAQRALVLAALLGRALDGIAPAGTGLPRDVEVLRRGLEVLSRGGGEVDCQDGGAPFRFLLTQAALTPGAMTRFVGTPRLGERPHQPLVEALLSALGPLGLAVELGAPWPVVVRAPREPWSVPGFEVRGAESSQFASSLLLGAARVVRHTGRPCRVQLEGELASEGYLALTVRWLRAAGFDVVATASSGAAPAPSTALGVNGAAGAPGPLVQPPGRAPSGGERGGAGQRLLEVRGWRDAGPLPPVPGDWSALTSLLPLAWRSGAGVAGVARGGGHPDEAFASHLESVGLRLEVEGAVTHVRGAVRGGLDVDASACPDAVPALVALACVLPAPSTFRRVGVLRHKESDRVDGLRELALRVGASVEVHGETFTLSPGPAVAAFEFDARDDHRLAMAAATVARLSGARLAALRGADAVRKSFPGFWVEAAKAGVPRPPPG